jgi:hypothetical protein
MVFNKLGMRFVARLSTVGEVSTSAGDSKSELIAALLIQYRSQGKETAPVGQTRVAALQARGEGVFVSHCVFDSEESESQFPRPAGWRFAAPFKGPVEKAAIASTRLPLVRCGCHSLS